MVCLAQQFESLVNYSEQIVRRKSLPRSVDVQVACNEAIFQWIKKEVKYKDQQAWGDEPPPLLKHIVTRRLLDLSRVEMRGPSALSDQDITQFPSHHWGPGLDEMEVSNDESESQVSHLKQALKDYFARREPEVQDIIQMRLVAGMSAREVAIIMQCTENAIHLHVSRFIGFMKKAAEQS